MARVPFRGSVPDGLLYDTEHDMWVRREGDEVVVGATSLGAYRAGDIIAFTAKPAGARIEAGRGLGTVECAKTVLAVHCPLAMDLLLANEAAEANPAGINGDPYGAGWMARGRPLDWARDAARLVDAARYRSHVRAQEPDGTLT